MFVLIVIEMLADWLMHAPEQRVYAVADTLTSVNSGVLYTLIGK